MNGPLHGHPWENTPWDRQTYPCVDCRTATSWEHLDPAGRCRPCSAIHDDRQATLRSRGSRKHEKSKLRGWNR